MVLKNDHHINNFMINKKRKKQRPTLLTKPCTTALHCNTNV